VKTKGWIVVYEILGGECLMSKIIIGKGDELISNDYNQLFSKVIGSIEKSKLQAFTQVNLILLKIYWDIGGVISENSKYGKSIVKKLSEDLKFKYPKVKGYSVTNLWNMKRFYETYNHFKQSGNSEQFRGLDTRQKLQTLSGDLLFQVSWSNHVLILDSTETIEEKEFYIKNCIKEKWSNRELKRQLNTMLFERFVTVDKPEKLLALIPKHKKEDLVGHFKDNYLLEFLGLEKNYSEKKLEQAILDNLRDFFLEFGKLLAFLGSQYVIDVGGVENRIDLLFFHRELNCLVAVDLKIGKFKAAYVGQMQKYLAALDEKVRLPKEMESIGLILCKSKNHEEVKFALAKTTSSVKVATYKTKLPDQKLIIERLSKLKLKLIVGQ
jgi:predicted nuclease of restriction endonuclease-like (RecB) superfamily